MKWILIITFAYPGAGQQTAGNRVFYDYPTLEKCYSEGNRITTDVKDLVSSMIPVSFQCVAGQKVDSK